MGKKKKVCQLCKVKRRDWEEGNFFGINCKKHFIPMIVLKKHENKLSRNERKEVVILAKKYYPKLHLDEFTYLCSDNHWHAHMNKKRPKK